MTSKLVVITLIGHLTLTTVLKGQVASESDQLDSAQSVLTQRNDEARTGAYLHERALTPEAVRMRGMRLLRRIPTGALVGAQLLYLHGLKFQGRRRNVVLAATAANTVLAIDVGDGTTLWVDSLRDREHAGRNLARPLTSTPVIDPLTRRMYVVYSTKNRARDFIPPGSLEPESTLDGLDVAFWLVALDVHTGRQLLARKIAATTRRSDGSILSFVAKNHRSRPALLLSHGSVYVAFGARPKEEEIEYHGWVMRYDANTLDQLGVFCTSRDARRPHPDSTAVGQGAGIWQSNAGLAADSIGQVYLLSGNARAEPAKGSFGNSFIKLAPGQEGGLPLAGSFSPEGHDRRLERYDWDLGSGGPLVIPGTSLVTGGGKTGMVYLIDARTMRPRQSFQAAKDMYARTGAGIGSDTAWYAGPQLRGSLTFWRGPDRKFAYVYLWGARDYLRAYTLSWSKQLFDTIPAAVGSRLVPSAESGVIPGGMLSLSANGTSPKTGILWATLRVTAGAEYMLAAFDAESLDEIWSTKLPGLSYHQPPTIAAGLVMVATRSDDGKRVPEIRIYGLADVAH